MKKFVDMSSFQFTASLISQIFPQPIACSRTSRTALGGLPVRLVPQVTCSSFLNTENNRKKYQKIQRGPQTPAPGGRAESRRAARRLGPARRRLHPHGEAGAATGGARAQRLLQAAVPSSGPGGPRPLPALLTVLLQVAAGPRGQEGRGGVSVPACYTSSQIVTTGPVLYTHLEHRL